MYICYVNGEFVNQDDAKVSINDRGYLFSDGVYEVAFIKNKNIFAWTEHCERLRFSLNGLKINYNFNDEELKNIVLQLLDKNNMSDSLVYVQITRGAAVPRTHNFPPKDTKPSIVVMTNKLAVISDKDYEYGASAITTEDLRWKKRCYKNISLLPNILAKQQAYDANVAEAILIEDNGMVTEGSSSNLFIIKDNQLITHPANDLILNGITRQIIISLARQNDINVEERAFSKDEMLNADEAFTTSTSKGVYPIVDIDGKKIGNGEVGEITRSLLKIYDENFNNSLAEAA